MRAGKSETWESMQERRKATEEKGRHKKEKQETEGCTRQRHKRPNVQESKRKTKHIEMREGESICMLARGRKCMSKESSMHERGKHVRGELQDGNTQKRREVCQPGEEHKGEGSRQERGRKVCERRGEAREKVEKAHKAGRTHI